MTKKKSTRLTDKETEAIVDACNYYLDRHLQPSQPEHVKEKARIVAAGVRKLNARLLAAILRKPVRME